MKKLIICLAFALALFCGSAFALDATTPELQPNDMSFVQEKQKDARIGGGTLVKVRSGIPNLQFYGWVIKSDERRPGEYWVFLETAGGKLQVAAEGGHAPVDIVIDDNTPEQVYVVTITEPGASPVSEAAETTHIDLPENEGRTHPGFDMVRLKNGRFVMGSNKGDAGADKDEMPAHRVLITKDFYIGDCEVTQSLWQYVMGNNPSTIKDRSVELPVENISWEDAHEFCLALSRLTGRKFRLPTEAEWEYAARGGHLGGANTIYSGSNDPDEVGWYEGTSGMRPHPVKSKKPNVAGIYDMSGNVYEMCEDSKENYKDQQQTDPMVEKGPTTDRVRRGGSWDASANSMRVAFRRRMAYDPQANCHYGAPDTGIRIVMEVED